MLDTIFIIAIAWIVCCARAATFVSPSLCKTTEYFDVSDLTCKSCEVATTSQLGPTNKAPDFTTTDFNGNALSCKCKSGYLVVPAQTCDANNPSVCAVTCGVCPVAGTAASIDGTICMPCNGTALAPVLSGANINLDCSCTGNNKLVEFDVSGRRLSSKTCVPCPTGFIVDPANRYSCLLCPDPNMAYSNGKCTCAFPKWTAAGVAGLTTLSCVDSALFNHIAVEFPVSTASSLTYNHLQTELNGAAGSQTIASLTVQAYYSQAATRCYNYRTPADIAYCQSLASLCVLNLYNPNAAVCTLFNRIQAVRGGLVHGLVSWASTMPMINYAGQDALTVVHSTDIQQVMSFNQATQTGTAEFMKFKLASFSVDGRFLGMEDLRNQLNFCDNSPPTGSGFATPAWLKFGTSFKQVTSCSLSSLLSKDTVFYDLYVVDQATGNLFPVPVRELSYNWGTAGFVNVNPTDNDASILDDVFYRRFMLFDTISGVTDSTLKTGVIRYLQTIRLRVDMQLAGKGKIYPPVLEISYVERPTSSLTNTGMDTGTVTFEVAYNMDLTAFWGVTQGLFSVSLVFAGGFTFLRLFNWQRRATREPSEVMINGSYLLRLIVYALTCSAAVLHALCLLLATYWFVFFKMQDSVTALLPPENLARGMNDNYYYFKLIVIMCWIGQLVRISEIVYRQSNLDICFMDWEKSKGKVTDRDGKSRWQPISAWRTILCVNEWGELQTTRRTSLEFTLVAMLLLMSGYNLQYLATTQPSLANLTPGPLNPVLLYWIVCCFWVAICWLQKLAKYAVIERWFSEPPEQLFVDMCTVAKVSVFMLDDKYHGYYLNCRTTAEYADETMEYIRETLTSEKEGLVAGRGLAEGKGDFQLFDLSVTLSWRKQYDEIFYGPLMEVMQVRGAGGGFQPSGAAGRAKRDGEVVKEKNKKLMRASAELTKFLRDYVDGNNDTHTREFRTSNFMERLFHIPPDMSAMTNSVWYGSSMGSGLPAFSKVIFIGVESDLMWTNVLTWVVAQWTFGSPVAAAVSVYVIESLVVYVRKYLGERNIAVKAQVDERFLV